VNLQKLAQLGLPQICSADMGSAAAAAAAVAAAAASAWTVDLAASVSGCAAAGAGADAGAAAAATAVAGIDDSAEDASHVVVCSGVTPADDLGFCPAGADKETSEGAVDKGGDCQG